MDFMSEALDMYIKDFSREAVFKGRVKATTKKAVNATTSEAFIKNCHTLIHQCSEALFMHDPKSAELIYNNLRTLITNTTCEF